MQSTDKCPWGGILREQKVRTTATYRAARGRLPTPSTLCFCYSLSVPMRRGPGWFKGMAKMHSCSVPEARQSAPSLGRCTRETAAGSGEQAWSGQDKGRADKAAHATSRVRFDRWAGRQLDTQSAWLAPSPATTVMYHFTDNGSSSCVCFFGNLIFFPLIFLFLFFFFRKH